MVKRAQGSPTGSNSFSYGWPSPTVPSMSSSTVCLTKRIDRQPKESSWGDFIAVTSQLSQSLSEFGVINVAKFVRKIPNDWSLTG